MITSMSAAVLIFAKYPTPGRVKTRLHRAFTPEQAAGIHEACLVSTLSRLAGGGSGTVPILLFTPDEDAARWDALLGRAGCDPPRWPQGPGDLGERLARAFRRGFEEGFERVLAVGSDSPTLWPEHLQRALAALADADLALGPTEDGGYYLVALNRHAPAVFADIDWGTDRVARQTLAAARSAGLRAQTLPMGYDLDRPEDVTRLLDGLGGHAASGADRALRSALRRIIADHGP